MAEDEGREESNGGFFQESNARGDTRSQVVMYFSLIFSPFDFSFPLCQPSKIDPGKRIFLE